MMTSRLTIKILPSLPQDVLMLILEEYMDSLGDNELIIKRLKSGERETETNLAALRVCRLWRSMLTSNSNLWTKIHVDFNISFASGRLDTPSRTQLTRLKRRLVWAKSRPIDFIFFCSVEKDQDTRGRLQREMWTMFMKRKPLFRTYYESGASGPGHILFRCMVAMEKNQFRYLTHLEVYEPFDCDAPDVYWDKDVYLPRLQSLRICLYYLRPFRVLNRFKCLNLKLLIVDSCEEVIMSDVSSVLLWFPRLQVFCSSFDFEEEPVLPPSFSSHPNLRHLAIREQRIFDHQLFLGSLLQIFPRLEVLTMEYIEMLCYLLADPDAPYLLSIKVLFILKSDEVKRSALDVEIWKKVLNLMPNLRSLTFGIGQRPLRDYTDHLLRFFRENGESTRNIGCRDTDLFLSILAERMGDGAPRYFPNLEHIVLKAEMHPKSFLTLKEVLEIRHLGSLDGKCPPCRLTTPDCELGAGIGKSVNYLKNVSFEEYMEDEVVDEMGLQETLDHYKSYIQHTWILDASNN